MSETVVMSERDKYIADLRDYRNLQEQATEAVEKVTLDRAAEVVALYKNRTLDGEPLERRWQDELPALKPTRRRGPKADPNSFERFLKWATEASGLGASTLKRFKQAHELAETITAPGGGNLPKPAGERSLRPLGYFKREGKLDEIPGVWKAAVELARDDGRETPSERHVRLATGEWKRDNEPKRVSGSGAAAPKVGQGEKFSQFLGELDRWLAVEPTLAVPAVRTALEKAEARAASVPPVEEW